MQFFCGKNTPIKKQGQNARVFTNIKRNLDETFIICCTNDFIGKKLRGDSLRSAQLILTLNIPGGMGFATPPLSRFW